MNLPRVRYRPKVFVCQVPHCLKACVSRGGLKRHARIHHAQVAMPQPPVVVQDDGDGDADEDFHLEHPEGLQPPDPSHRQIRYHPVINGTPCDREGHDIPADAAPNPYDHPLNDDWTPFTNRSEFEFADFLYRRAQMSGGKIDDLISILAAMYQAHKPPFHNHHDLYSTIDSIVHGDCPWQSFAVKYSGPLPENAPRWMLAEYDVWFRDPHTVLEQQLANVDFKGHIDYAAKVITDEQGQREVSDLMSGQWAWDQSEIIAEDPETHGAMFAPVVLGSDKTIVSVGTGHTEYYPLYGSLGNLHNNIRRAHRNGVALLAFFAILKTDHAHKDDADFRLLRRKLFHSSLTTILQPLKPAMTRPCVTRCADGHFRRVVYGLGPYIADYPEQALLACIVQGWCTQCTAPRDDLDGGGSPRAQMHTEQLLRTLDYKILWDDYGIVGDIEPFTVNFPHADIHELIAPDLLHQMIKGCFKDHLVTWVGEYLEISHGKQQAAEIIADIDRRIAAVPLFTRLRRFPEGRGFTQWTGDDSKALMKVYLPAIVGHVPDQMVRALSAFLQFCYLVRQSVINEANLDAIEDAVRRFHIEREIFITTGVREQFNLPRQHAMIHYRELIEQFGVPNGLCSSITESRHIKAVKEPWRRSNRFEALGQMLLTNQRLDKLAAARVDFSTRGMLAGPLGGDWHEGEGGGDSDNEGDGAVEGQQSTYDVLLAQRPVRGVPRTVRELAEVYNYPELFPAIRRFLYDQVYPDAEVPGDQVPLHQCPSYHGEIKVFQSTSATYYAPSDQCGKGGMHRDIIQCTPSWRGGQARHDCVFVDNGGGEGDGLRGLLVARVLLFFSLRYELKTYSCALVDWYLRVAEEPDEATGMWIVAPEQDRDGQRVRAVISLDAILRPAHLIGVYGNVFLPIDFHYADSLDAFNAYFVNKYIDYHANTIAF